MVTKRSEFTWYVDYTPKEPGLHSVNIFFAGKAIPHSPYPVGVSSGKWWGHLVVSSNLRCNTTHDFRCYKKVLLRERKRHTARRVASARYADLSRGGGGGLPHLRSGQTWDGVPPARPGMRYTPPPLGRPGMGYPPPPRNVNRQTPVKTVPSRHTTYAGGKNRTVRVPTDTGKPGKMRQLFPVRELLISH